MNLLTPLVGRGMVTDAIECLEPGKHFRTDIKPQSVRVLVSNTRKRYPDRAYQTRTLHWYTIVLRSE